MSRRRTSAALPLLPLLLLPPLLLLLGQAPRPGAQPPGQPGVALDGRELAVPVTITPGGPLFGLAPLARALGGELRAGEGEESFTLMLGATPVVLGIGSSVVTVGEQIVSLSQPAARGEDGPLVPLDFLARTFGDAAGYSFDWRPGEQRLVISRRSARELPVALDVVHLQGTTTVVLQFPEVPHYRLREQPGLVEVEMLADRLTSRASPEPLQDPLVRDVEIARERVRIRLAPGAEAESYVLENPFRLVFDVHQPATLAAPPGPGLTAPEPAGGIRTIVLDPGHGGSESGAVGPSGVAEKELTLLLAHALAGRLQQEVPVRVVLTRTEDASLPLETRTAIANQNKADLFVSIHLNSSLGAGANGAETYFLSTQATDPRAAFSAAAENRQSGAPASAADLAEQDLRLILWDLAQSYHLAESQRFATLIQGELNAALQLRDRGVKQAPFRVLMGAAMPAVLVELGFLNNPDEETKLQDPAYRDQLVGALVRAIARYKQQVEGAAPAARQAPAGPQAPAEAPAAEPGETGTS